MIQINARPRPLLLLCVAVWLSGCASSESVVIDSGPPEPESEAAVVRPDLDVIQSSGGALTMTRLSDERDVEIGEEDRVLFVRESPDRVRAILALEGEEMTRLVSVHRENGLVFMLGAAPNGVRYTVDWNADGTEAAFGTDLDEVNSSSGSRVQRFLAAQGRVENVGCSASNRVLAWLPDGSLLVRGGDNLYVVDRTDCATLRSIDARKMHHVSVSPSGEHMSWIQRELVYNRETRAYDPDSTLFVSPTSGGEGEVVVDSQFKPRHMVWSHDGTELAFDVELESGSRVISIYSVGTGQTSYLMAPIEGAPSQSEPAFSPTGRHNSFIEQGPGGKRLMVKLAGESFARPAEAPLSSAPTGQSWVTDGIILVMSGDGVGSLVNVETGEVVETPQTGGILWAMGPVQ